jgi:hypothetical protein
MAATRSGVSAHAAYSEVLRRGWRSFADTRGPGWADSPIWRAAQQALPRATSSPVADVHNHAQTEPRQTSETAIRAVAEVSLFAARRTGADLWRVHR